MNLTDEQKDIILISQNMRPNEILKIQACAGSGKTSTLIEIARANPNAKFLYLAFNKAIVEEVKNKFSNNVKVKTTHSLAHNRIIAPKKYQIKNSKFNFFDLQGILSIYNYDDFLVFDKELKIFSQSMAKKFPNDLIKKLFTLAKNGEIPYTHDMYLKEFQMLPSEQRGLDSYNFILLDEAQDTNEVTLDIFEDNNCKKILVGDTFQNIYGFRGTTINALEVTNATYNKCLNYSFRCKQEILDKASFFINRYANKNMRFISAYNPNQHKKTEAFITRTNAGIIDKIAEIIANKEMRNFKIIKNPDSIFASSIDCFYFKNGIIDKISPESKWFLNFVDIKTLKEHAKKGNDIETCNAIELVDKYGSKIFDFLEKAKSMYNATNFDIELTNAHISKGKEWDIVTLHKDFADLYDLQQRLSLAEWQENNEKSAKNIINLKVAKAQLIKFLKEEVNLYYVAITRAKEILIDNTPNNTEWESYIKSSIQTNQISIIQNVNLDSNTSKGSSQNNKIYFSIDDRQILQEKLTFFFNSSHSFKKNQESWLSNGCVFIQKIEALLSNYYYVEGKFDSSKWGSYIVFMRRDMRRNFNVKTRWGVYCRVHFSPNAPQDSKIEVSLNFSGINKYNCNALQQMQSYNESNKNISFFAYPNYNMDLVIDKLQRDLNYFLEIPLSELQPLR